MSTEYDFKKKIKEGDESAFKSLFIQHYSILSAFAYRFIQETEASKDIVQTVFIRIYTNRNSLEIESSIKSYLYKAVYNECLNELRKNKVRQHYTQEYSERADTVYYEEAIEQNEKESSIYRAIENLPDRCKEIFIMSRLEGKKNQEIASALGLSIRTVETQISLALKNLRKVLLSFIWLFFNF